MKTRICPVCSGAEREIEFKQQFSEFSDESLLKAYNVVSCSVCGFCFADLIPDQEIFNAYYTNLSKYENLFDNEFKESKYDLNRFQIIASYFKDFFASKDESILEIGCSTGMFLAQLKKSGFTNLTGIDPSPGCSKIAKEQYGVEVITNTLADFSFPENSFDAVVLIGVLEHVKDLDESLQRMRAILKPSGKLFIVVPDASQYFKGFDAPFQEFSVEHINYFGPVSSDNLMVKNGFKKGAHRQVLIEVNHKTITPALMSVFEKTDKQENELTVLKDTELVTNIKLYIKECLEREEKVKEKIQQVIETQSDIVIWGTGAQTLRLLANSNLNEARITAFVDSNLKYQGKTINNIPIIGPGEMTKKSEKILISTRAYQDEISDFITNSLQLKNEIIKLY